MKYLKLMADYKCYPIWNMSHDDYGDIPPSALPISKELQERLLKWAALYEETLDEEYPPDSRFETEEMAQEFRLEGERLAACLREELGSNYCISVSINI